jgi:hypothetical protein
VEVESRTSRPRVPHHGLLVTPAHARTAWSPTNATHPAGANLTITAPSRVPLVVTCLRTGRRDAPTVAVIDNECRFVGQLEEIANAHGVLRDSRQSPTLRSAMRAMIIACRAGEWRLAFSPRRHPGTTGERPLPRRSHLHAASSRGAASPTAWRRELSFERRADVFADVATRPHSDESAADAW